MTRPQSAAMMDAVFESDEEAKGRLLKIMQGFLISESEKHAAIQKGTASFDSRRMFSRDLVPHQRKIRKLLKLSTWTSWLATPTGLPSLGQ